MAGGLGAFFFLSLYIQNVLHYSPVATGLCFLPIPILIGIVSYNTPRLLGKFGFKPLMTIGMSLIICAIFLISRLGIDSSYWTHIFPAFIIMGFGFGMSFVSITVASTSGVPADKSGLASGLVNTSQQVGGALGLAILAVIANTATTVALSTGQSIAEATVHGYQQAFLTSTVLVVIALLIAIFVIQTPKQQS
jgi:predicted MFS family arabinose efflux permease